MASIAGAETTVGAQGPRSGGRGRAAGSVEFWTRALDVHRGATLAGVAGAQALVVEGVGRAGEARTPGEGRVDEQRRRDDAAREAADATAGAGAEASAGTALGRERLPEREGTASVRPRNESSLADRAPSAAGRGGDADAAEDARSARSLEPGETGGVKAATTLGRAPRGSDSAPPRGDAAATPPGGAGVPAGATPVDRSARVSVTPAGPAGQVALRPIQSAKPAEGDALLKLVAIGAERRGVADAAKQKALAPGSTARSLTAEEREALIGQVTRGLGEVLKRGGGELTLRLRPEGLGSVRVHLRFEEQRVGALVEASDETARGLLGERVVELRAALEARGLEVDEVRVELSPWEGEGHGWRGGGREDGSRGGERPAERGPWMGGDPGGAGVGGGATDGGSERGATGRAWDARPGGVGSAPEASWEAAGDAARGRSVPGQRTALAVGLDVTA